MPRVAFFSGRKSLLLLAVAAIIGGEWWLHPPPEPEYHDVPLSAWLTRAALTTRFDIEEFHAFGPAAIPWLVHTLEHGRLPVTRNGTRPLAKAPSWLRRWFPERWGGLRKSPWNDNLDYRAAAAWALLQAGPEAAAATPALIRSLDRTSRNEKLAGFAAEALHGFGPADWPAVRQTLEHGSLTARSRLLSTIYIRLGSDKNPAAPAEIADFLDVLVNALADPAPSVRKAAALGFAGCCGASPDLPAWDTAIPGVTHLLADPDATVRDSACYALWECGTRASAAVPPLIALLQDPAPAVRRSAAKALGRADVDGKQSAQGLRALLHDTSTQCSDAAAEALAVLGLSLDENDASKEVGRVP